MGAGASPVFSSPSAPMVSAGADGEEAGGGVMRSRDCIGWGVAVAHPPAANAKISKKHTYAKVFFICTSKTYNPHKLRHHYMKCGAALQGIGMNKP
jgi:hypothetical protein